MENEIATLEENLLKIKTTQPIGSSSVKRILISELNESHTVLGDGVYIILIFRGETINPLLGLELTLKWNGVIVNQTPQETNWEVPCYNSYDTEYDCAWMVEAAGYDYKTLFSDPTIKIIGIGPSSSNSDVITLTGKVYASCRGTLEVGYLEYEVPPIPG